MNGSKRLEYIDAMRGATMLLVVIAHVVGFSYNGIEGFSWGNFFTLFRMPLFFFVSGFIFYKSSRTWTFDITKEFVKRKFCVQIVPTVCFLTVYAYMYNFDVMQVLDDKYKAGYWFTLVLFYYFCFHAIISMLLIKTNWGGKVLILSGLLFLFLDSRFAGDLMCKYGFINVLSIQQWKYFIFFELGVWVRRYFDFIQRQIDNSFFIPIVIVLFLITTCIWYGTECNIWEMKFRFLLWGICGIIICFSFFRKYEKNFSRMNIGGRVIQYIGRRTLDIYLLHYFFLPRNLDFLGRFFTDNPNPTIELFVSIVISFMVIALCLFVSNIIRLSPFLSHWLFGVNIAEKSHKSLL